MTNEEKRIKLAEAMFPDYEIKTNRSGEPIMAYQGRWDSDNSIRNVPDPFTDANADYAVLEFMRTQSFDVFEAFAKALNTILKNGGVAVHYTIGDYANAALKVLDNE